MGLPPLGWQRPRLRLLDEELHLDPEIEAQIRVLQAEIQRGRFQRILLRPDFSQFSQSHLSWMLRQPLPAPRPPLVPAGAGPSTPRPAQIGDLGRAVWAVPALRQAVTQLGEEATRDLRRGWSQAGAGERAAIVSTGLLITGGALAGALANDQSRLDLLTFVDGRNIPVPGVDGLSFRLTRRGSSLSGGGVTAPLGVPGLSLRGNFTAGEGDRWLRNAQYDVFLSFDLMQYLRSRR
ncbi:MAG: hypothetical protein R2748_14820 [Bryobacterales bacterium]